MRGGEITDQSPMSELSPMSSCSLEENHQGQEPEYGNDCQHLIEQLGHKNYSDDFNGNNFISENEFLEHFEKSYEEEFSKNVQNDVNEEVSQKVAKSIKAWLTEMNKSLNYIYDHEPTEDEYEDIPNIDDIDNRVCDPYISVDDIDEDDIDEVTNIVNNKKIAKVQGKCSVRLKDGTEIIGRWQNGVRQGQGSYCSPELEAMGINMLAGSYIDGFLTGVTRIHMADGSVREGWFLHGFANGPFKGDIKGTGTVWLGCYKRGVPFGFCWEAVLGGLWKVGWLDTDGEFSGGDVAVLYPDLKTAIRGRYRRGQLVSGSWSRVKSVTLHTGLLVPSFEKMSNSEFKQWPSDKLSITVPPHLRDPYEDQMVEVISSSISGSGDGLRVKTDVRSGTIVAFYHGLRMKATDENPFGPPTGYAIYLEWDRDKREISDVLDMSPEMQSTANYTATLAHKVNHSFSPNCEWVHVLHPCFGKIPAIQTMEDLEAGDELFIHYGFDMDEAPQWYKDFWMKQE